MYELSAAATVVLLRQRGPDLELLLTERSKALGFAGGAMVFPGGKVDAGDLEIARNPALSIGFDDLADTDAAARVAAARESFEEVGIVLSTGPALDAATIAAWRARFSRVADADESATFAAFLEATGHRADAARMTPFSHWVPPAGLHRRFDTLFYITSVRDDDEAIPDGTETALVRWMTAAAALAAADAGELGVIFPTIGAALAGIRYFGDFERFSAISDVTAAKLDAVHQRLTLLLSAPDHALSYAQVSELAHAADEIVVSEIENWQAVFGGKHITVPV